MTHLWTWGLYILSLVLCGFWAKHQQTQHIRKMVKERRRKDANLTPEEMDKLYNSYVIIEALGITFEDRQ